MTDRGALPARTSANADVVWWLAAALAVLLFHAPFWKHARDIAPLAVPETAVDRVSPDLARQWTLLMNAREWIPPGSDYTVRSEPPDREMSLYMLSMGIFPRSRPVPSSYYLVPYLSLGNRAKYVIDENCRFAGTPPAQIIGRFPGGCVRRR
jgi:hypothetical protein